MRRTTVLIIPLLLLAVLVAVVTAEIPDETRLPSRVEIRLDQYLDSSLVPSQTTAVRVEQASKPWHFTRELSQVVLGDSVYFQTDASLTWKEGSGLSPLPFPPKELWCAFLEHEDAITGNQTGSVVFVGLHMDMYSGDWLVHVGAEAPFTREFEELLRRIGCDEVLD